jgi:predicted N-acetyltransferase YhbS
MRAQHRAGPEDPTFRIAYPGDAHQIAAIVADAFEAYRLWAPSDWSPPRLGEEEELVLARALRRADVWCMLALAGGEVVGHVALAPFTAVDPGPTPSGTTNLWQLFVRQQWQGRGVAANLAVRALRRSGTTRLRPNSAVDSEGRTPCPPVLRGAGLEADRPGALSLAFRAAPRRSTGRLLVFHSSSAGRASHRSGGRHSRDR